MTEVVLSNPIPKGGGSNNAAEMAQRARKMPHHGGPTDSDIGIGTMEENAAAAHHHYYHQQHLIMGGADPHANFTCPQPCQLSTTPVQCGAGGSPRHQMRSPRCEAFVMTGDKMLNLNPKISPYYAKVCQNQLPPTVEVDSEEQQKQQQQKQLLASSSPSTTPTKKHPFDEFPSMHKNARKRMQSATSTSNADDSGAASSASMLVPESRSEHTLGTANSSAGSAFAESGSGTGRKMQKPRGPLATGDSFDDGSGATNIVPADPSSSTKLQPYGSSISTLPEHLPTGMVLEAQLRHKQQQQGSGEDALVDEPPLSKATNISRFIASASSHSQSTPASPARGGFQQQQGDQYSKDGTVPAHSGSIKDSTDTMMVMQSAYSPETISRLARHLFTHQEGIKIAAFLVKSDDLSLQIAHEFVALFNFAGYRVDVALRTFLSHVCLTGETMERAQLLSHFAQRYHECNPTVFDGFDEIHALACALLLLNTDLHGKASKKMSCREFIDNLLNTDYKYDLAMLKELYASVKEQPFHYKADAGQFQPSASTAVGMGREKRLSRVLSKRSPNGTGPKSSVSSGLIDPEQQVDYKHGWLVKKSMYDSDGKKTPLGRRRWQMLYATIRGMVLYLHQNENSFSSARYITFRNCILLHHSLAEIPRDYTKRKNVFLLRTASLGEFLFQTSDPSEVQKWIDAINYVAAAFSTPALPTPVGTNGLVAFYKPHLPSTPTHLSIPDQLRAHEQRLEETTTNLERLRENAPSMKAKGKVVYDYFYKERFLDKERQRYTIYVKILREKLARATSTLRCDSQASNTLLNGGGGRNNSCKPSTASAAAPAAEIAIQQPPQRPNGTTAAAMVTANGNGGHHHHRMPPPRTSSTVSSGAGGLYNNNNGTGTNNDGGCCEGGGSAAGSYDAMQSSVNTITICGGTAAGQHEQHQQQQH